ncbi:MAG TPA: DUF72 domain-containing protein [Cytophagaceae bacterium]|jgi:uncharacterized protein YecE (DUF72 family)|nr:DUF72 domain-containing protein [Cytophagaceae bacterium]
MSGSKFRVGCSGFYYTAWKNKFYPTGLQPKNWLAYYSTVFNSVELNGTFYRTPKLSDLTKYAHSAVHDFRFSVKASRYITHVLKLKDSKQHIEDFQDLITEGLQNKCAHFLFQMPPSFHYNEENLNRILENIAHFPTNVVELRHLSWWNEEVEKAFKQVGLTFCNVDFPGLNTYFMHTSSHFYLRLHGKPELFKSSYDVEALNHFCKQVPVSAQSVNVYFNNTYDEAGYTNALQLQEMLACQ